MAILCLGNRSLRIDGYWFIRNCPPTARCARVRVCCHGALPARRGGSPPDAGEENAAEAALVGTLEVIGVAGLEGRHSHAPRRTTFTPDPSSRGHCATDLGRQDLPLVLFLF